MNLIAIESMQSTECTFICTSSKYLIEMFCFSQVITHFEYTKIKFILRASEIDFYLCESSYKYIYYKALNYRLIH